MARPIKNNCDYFSHDRDMRDHKKVKAIRSKFGITGYAVWVMLLEYLTGNDGNVFEYSDLEFELMSGDFGLPSADIKMIVDYCISLEMLFNRNGFVNSDSLDERLKSVYEKRGKSKELSGKQLRANGKFVSSNTDSTVVSVAETPQSKVKESKVNKSKEFKDVDSVLDWQKWGDDIVDGNDYLWEQMRGRKVGRQEMDSFISVAVRNGWVMETQQSFRLCLKGFKDSNTKALPLNPGKLQ